MKISFDDQTFAFEFLRMLGATAYGGADIGECFVAAAAITDGDTESWYHAWNNVAQRVHASTDAALQAGHRVSARDALLRASNYYRCAEFFLHLEPDDPRALPTYDQGRACFQQMLPLLPFPAETVQIPYATTSLPGYLYLVDASATSRPTILLHGGYDSTAEEEFINHVPAALERGYNCLVFEGPGQGYVRRHQGLPFGPDWEHGGSAVVEYALTRSELDARRLALIGRSLGGYLAPRAAAFEHRLAACVAIDGLFSFVPSTDAVLAFGGGQMPTSAAPPTEDHINAQISELATQSLGMRWAISQGLWSFAVASPAALVQQMQMFTMDGIAAQVVCPTLVCDAAADHFFAGQPHKLYDALRCSKTLLHFGSEDGAEEHCHAGAARLLNQRVFDWLDTTLAEGAAITT